jgi:Glycosyl transferase family 11
LELAHFNLHRDSFATAQSLVPHQAEIIEDGALKLQLGLAALRQENIQNLFTLHQANVAHLLGGGRDKYLCIHIRRGDYLNVASHLISDDAFVRLAKRFVDLMNHAVIVSDSVVTDDLRARLSSLFAKTTFLDHINEYETHCVMRGAHILIGSNSQFSLIAAILNTKGLVLLPRTWFGDEQPELEALVSDLGDFQVLSDVT